MTECRVAEGQCDRESQCGVRGSWQKVNSVLDNALRAVSLADMLGPAAADRKIAVTVNAGAAITE
jgi:DNA-binding IscR family transcriptional regulator